MTYDTWKTTNPDDQLLGPELPPCEWHYGRLTMPARWPGGDCTACGALSHESCKWGDEECD